MKHNHRWTRWVTPAEAQTLGWYASPFTRWTRRCTVSGCGTVISRMDDPPALSNFWGPGAGH